MKATKIFYEAFGKAQSQYTGRLESSGKSNYGKYTKIGDIYKAVRGSLYDNGIIIEHHGDIHEGLGCQIMRTRLIHMASGEYIEDVRICENEKPGNQAKGGADTYMKKYALKALCAIDIGEDDDDGQAEADWIAKNKQRGPRLLNSAQLAALQNRLRDTQAKGVDVQMLHDVILEQCKVPTLHDLTNDHMKLVNTILNQFG